MSRELVHHSLFDWESVTIQWYSCSRKHIISFCFNSFFVSKFFTYFQSPILPPSYRINSSSSCPPPPITPSSPYTADDDARSPYAVPPSPLNFFRSSRQNERGGRELSTCPVFPRKKSFRQRELLKIVWKFRTILREFVGNVCEISLKTEAISWSLGVATRFLSTKTQKQLNDDFI